MCDELCHDFYIEERQSFDAMVMGVSENRACPEQKGYDDSMIVQKSSDALGLGTLGPELSMRDYNHFN